MYKPAGAQSTSSSMEGNLPPLATEICPLYSEQLHSAVQGARGWRCFAVGSSGAIVTTFLLGYAQRTTPSPYLIKVGPPATCLG